MQSARRTRTKAFGRKRDEAEHWLLKELLHSGRIPVPCTTKPFASQLGTKKAPGLTAEVVQQSSILFWMTHPPRKRAWQPLAKTNTMPFRFLLSTKAGSFVCGAS
ncbi:hypothetical protein ACSS6W_003903 [Trichoderma asperelloides]